MFSVNIHSVHHSNGRDELVLDFNTFCNVTRHNVHYGHVFHASRKSGVGQGKKHIVAAVAGCRKPLVSNGWASFAQMGLENATTTLYRLHF